MSCLTQIIWCYPSWFIIQSIYPSWFMVWRVAVCDVCKHTHVQMQVCLPEHVDVEAKKGCWLSCSFIPLPYSLGRVFLKEPGGRLVAGKFQSSSCLSPSQYWNYTCRHCYCWYWGFRFGFLCLLPYPLKYFLASFIYLIIITCIVHGVGLCEDIFIQVHIRYGGQPFLYSFSFTLTSH